MLVLNGSCYHVLVIVQILSVNGCIVIIIICIVIIIIIIINNFTCFRKKISKHGQQRNKQINDESRIRTEKESLELLTEGLKAEISCP